MAGFIYAIEIYKYFNYSVFETIDDYVRKTCDWHLNGEIKLIAAVIYNSVITAVLAIYDWSHHIARSKKKKLAIP